jgi:hypothetical protein
VSTEFTIFSHEQEELYYLLGIEPVSINACLSGYKSASKSLIKGGFKQGKHKDAVHCAQIETKEEAHIDIFDLVENKILLFKEQENLIIIRVDETIEIVDGDNDIALKVQQQEVDETTEDKELIQKISATSIH